MNKRFYVLSILVLLSLSCQNKKDVSPQFRMVNTSDKSIKIDVSAKQKGQKVFEITPFSVSDYKSLPANIYKLAILADKKPVLNKEYGLASEEKYTAIFYGKPDLSSTLNQQTTTNKLHYIFAGSENHIKNGFLPKLFLFRDRIKVNSGQSSIRIFNAAVGTSPLTVRLKRKNESKQLVKELAYGKPMLSTSVKKGKVTLEVLLSNSPKPILTKQLTLESKKIYTLVILKNEENISVKVLTTQSDD